MAHIFNYMSININILNYYNKDSERKTIGRIINEIILLDHVPKNNFLLLKTTFLKVNSVTYINLIIIRIVFPNKAIKHLN